MLVTPRLPIALIIICPHYALSSLTDAVLTLPLLLLLAVCHMDNYGSELSLRHGDAMWNVDDNWPWQGVSGLVACRADDAAPIWNKR